MRKYIILIKILLLSSTLLAQQDGFKYIDGHLLSLRGTCFAGADDYNRIDSVNRKYLPARVQELSQNTAGLNINFETNAKSIKLKWELQKWMHLWNMTPLAVNGLDLYAFNQGKWQYVASARPTDKTNSVLLIDDLDGKMRKYRLHLPLYSSLQKLEVGVPDTSSIIAIEKPFSNPKKVVIYGSSITQGASASRPGMAYPSIVSRKLDVETINLGFSGSGKMELEVAKILARMPADVYILDCVPNPSPQQIHERAVPFIQYLRKMKPDVPIIMLESIYREKANWNNKTKKMVEAQNREFKSAYEQLRKENPTNLFYVYSENLTGTDHETSIDGTHLTDLGFMRLSDAISKQLKKCFSICVRK